MRFGGKTSHCLVSRGGPERLVMVYRDHIDQYLSARRLTHTCIVKHFE